MEERGTECGERRIGSGERCTPGNLAKHSMKRLHKLRKCSQIFPALGPHSCIPVFIESSMVVLKT